MSGSLGASGTGAEVPLSAVGSSRRWWLLPLLIFLLSRVVAGVLIGALSHSQPAPTPPAETNPAHVAGANEGYLQALTNYDGQWYSTIAQHGYPLQLPHGADGAVEQNPWAFYPVYPGLVRLVMFVTRTSFPLAATTVSMLAGAGAILLLYRLLRPTAGELNTLLAIAALSSFPAAPVLQAAYSESLALLLLVLALLLLRSRRYGWLMACVLVLSLTRPIVLPFALVVAWHWWTRWRGRATDPFPVRDRVTVGAVAVATVASFGIWPLAAGIVTGVPDAYLQTQLAWGAGNLTSTSKPTWLFLAFLAPLFAPIILGLALALALLVLLPRSRAWGDGTRAWALSYAAFILLATRSTSSVTRFAMLLLVWWPFAFNPSKQLHPVTRALLLAATLAVGFTTQYYWTKWFFTSVGPLQAP